MHCVYDFVSFMYLRCFYKLKHLYMERKVKNIAFSVVWFFKNGPLFISEIPCNLKTKIITKNKYRAPCTYYETLSNITKIRLYATRATRVKDARFIFQCSEHPYKSFFQWIDLLHLVYFVRLCISYNKKHFGTFV